MIFQRHFTTTSKSWTEDVVPIQPRKGGSLWAHAEDSKQGGGGQCMLFSSQKVALLAVVTNGGNEIQIQRIT